MLTLVAVFAVLLLHSAVERGSGEPLPEDHCLTQDTYENHTTYTYPIPQSDIVNDTVTLKFQVRASRDASIFLLPKETIDEDSDFYYEIALGYNGIYTLVRRLPYPGTKYFHLENTTTNLLSPSTLYNFTIEVSPEGYWTVSRDDLGIVVQGQNPRPEPLHFYNFQSRNHANVTWVFNYCRRTVKDRTSW